MNQFAKAYKDAFLDAEAFNRIKPPKDPSTDAHKQKQELFKQYGALLKSVWSDIRYVMNAHPPFSIQSNIDEDYMTDPQGIFEGDVNLLQRMFDEEIRMFASDPFFSILFAEALQQYPDIETLVRAGAGDLPPNVTAAVVIQGGLAAALSAVFTLYTQPVSLLLLEKHKVPEPLSDMKVLWSHLDSMKDVSLFLSGRHFISFQSYLPALSPQNSLETGISFKQIEGEWQLYTSNMQLKTLLAPQGTPLTRPRLSCPIHMVAGAMSDVDNFVREKFAMPFITEILDKHIIS